LKKHDGRSIRINNYDYFSSGGYFITPCVRDRLRVLCDIVDRNIRLRGPGNIAQSCWNKITGHFSNVVLDESVVMPDHIHGIIITDSGNICDTNIDMGNLSSISSARPAKNSRS